MNLYLTRHQYGNTFTEDLWAALEEASQMPVGRIMSGWTKQMGFPVIGVTAEQQEGDKRLLRFSQKRFIADGSCDVNNTRWMVPIEIATSRSPSQTVKSFVLEGETSEIVLDDIKADEWIKVRSHCFLPVFPDFIYYSISAESWTNRVLPHLLFRRGIPAVGACYR